MSKKMEDYLFIASFVIIVPVITYLIFALFIAAGNSGELARLCHKEGRAYQYVPWTIGLTGECLEKRL